MAPSWSAKAVLRGMAHASTSSWCDDRQPGTSRPAYGVSTMIADRPGIRATMRPIAAPFAATVSSSSRSGWIAIRLIETRVRSGLMASKPVDRGLVEGGALAVLALQGEVADPHVDERAGDLDERHDPPALVLGKALECREPLGGMRVADERDRVRADPCRRRRSRPASSTGSKARQPSSRRRSSSARASASAGLTSTGRAAACSRRRGFGDGRGVGRRGRRSRSGVDRSAGPSGSVVGVGTGRRRLEPVGSSATAPRSARRPWPAAETRSPSTGASRATGPRRGRRPRAWPRGRARRSVRG